MNRVSTQARANIGAEGAGTEGNVVETRFIASQVTNGNERHIMPRHITMTNETQR